MQMAGAVDAHIRGIRAMRCYQRLPVVVVVENNMRMQANDICGVFRDRCGCFIYSEAAEKINNSGEFAVPQFKQRENVGVHTGDFADKVTRAKSVQQRMQWRQLHIADEKSFVCEGDPKNYVDVLFDQMATYQVRRKNKPGQGEERLDLSGKAFGKQDDLITALCLAVHYAPKALATPEVRALCIRSNMPMPELF